ncbi:MAG: hypothetical protein NZ742_03715 [Acidobacteria bacterium]|nr:hypothetical protein [Acidobacteriota bacterium]MDW7983277.1 hypothetical protein [Acidobacteriota bacterium]
MRRRHSWIPADLQSKRLTGPSGHSTLADVPGRLYVGWGVFAFLWPETVERLEATRSRMAAADRLIVAVLTGEALRKDLGLLDLWVPLEQRVVLAAGLRTVDYVLVWRKLDPSRWAQRWRLRRVDWLGLLEPLGLDDR